MGLWVLGFSGGIWTLQWFKVLPPWWGCLIVALLVFLLWYYAPPNLKKLYFLLFSMIIGLSWAVVCEMPILSFKLPLQWLGKNVLIRGKIVSIPKATPLADTFYFRLSEFNHKPESSLIRLAWYRPHPRIMVDDRWQLTVRLKPPHGLHNPGGFDYQRWLFLKGVRASGYVVNHRNVRLLKRSNSITSMARLREQVQMMITHAVHKQAIAAILAALTVGSRALMSHSEWQVFQATGTSHLMAISGLHIGLVAAAAYFLISALWRLSTFLCLRIPAMQASAVGAIVFAMAYGLLAGFSLPTQRAVIMITVLMISQLFYQSIPIWRRLLLAFAVIIMLQPLALYSVSFWLSFVAVGSIAYGMAGRAKSQHRVRQWGRLQWVLLIGLAPLTLLFFKKISLVMLIANLVAVPWVGFIIVPLCLIACLSSLISNHLATTLFFLTGKVMWPLWWWLQWLAKLPNVSWHHAIVNEWVFLSSVIAALLLLAPKGFPARWLGLIWALPLFFYSVSKPPLRAIKLTLLDVGQGLSVIVQTAHHLLLYDTGPKSRGGFDAGQSVIIPYLRFLNIKSIDQLVVSHGDNDHIGGAKAVLAMFPVQNIITSVPSQFVYYNAKRCYDGEHWQWDGVKFSMLYPPKNQSYQVNNSSCVLRIDNGKRVILLTGDIEADAEKTLLTHHKDQLSADLLIAPHHGSATSSTPAFIDVVDPKYVLFPVGEYNRYHFPAKSVLQRYHHLGSKIYTTAKSGAILVDVASNGNIRIRPTKKLRYYWQK